MRGRDEGSIALEFTLVAPTLLLLVMLLLGYARVSTVAATLDAGVRDAARAATTSRSADEAQARAHGVITAAVDSADCRDSLVVEPLPQFTPGRPVTVTARCSFSMADLGLPGLPGSLSAHSSFASPLDPNREVR